MPTPTALLIQLCRSNTIMQLFRCVTMQTHVLLFEAELGCDFHQLQQETMFHRTSQVAASVKVINERAFVMHRSAFEG